MTHSTEITAQPGSPYIEVVREFDATPAQVFRASTDPALIARWLGPRELAMRVVEYDVRTGGSYQYVHIDADGNEYGFRGVFHSVVDNASVTQTFEFDGAPGQVTLDSMTYENHGNGTRLRTRSVFPSVEARDGAISSGMEHGIVDSMDRLDELVQSA